MGAREFGKYKGLANDAPQSGVRMDAGSRTTGDNEMLLAWPSIDENDVADLNRVKSRLKAGFSGKIIPD